ncbi:MAG: RNA pseudouridine synthase [Clostridium sp.]|nr:RNA pseudouridine synthase [Prevotella sp.]MCM1429475.1 RNA pseudouridine synthase [Clostridium sp.]MCM1476222.1 RNA pseudouridine synthase [Muribaculaceae bacterium]
MDVVYEDNHIIVVNKAAGEIVQGDKTGDKPLSDLIKEWLKNKYNKPGNVFCGVVHRIDRPVSGLVIFAKTSKALSRLNDMLRQGKIHKSYLALVEGKLDSPHGLLEDYIITDGRINKSFIADRNNPEVKLCRLEYTTVVVGDNYTLLRINLLTGRKHQIRLQLSNIGHPIKGDLKYGARRSNRNGGISLQAAHIDFEHPVSHNQISLDVPPLREMQSLIKDGELSKDGELPARNNNN